jgi:hypothetical protein
MRASRFLLAVRCLHAATEGPKALAISSLILAGVGSAAFGQSAPPHFPGKQHLTGLEPHSVAVGDLNGDGKSDLVTANYSDNNVSVLLGGGLGDFATSVNFAAGVGPHEVAIGDFDGDGDADLATANFGTNDVSVLLGNGLGGFSAATGFAVGTGPWSVAIGDFNGDSKLDLVTANSGSNNVSVLLGNGLGAFGAATNFAVASYPRSIAVGDLNNDGKLDLVAANRDSNNVSGCLATAWGAAAAANFAVGFRPCGRAWRSQCGFQTRPGGPTPERTTFRAARQRIGSRAVATFIMGTTPSAVAYAINGDGKPT